MQTRIVARDEEDCKAWVRCIREAKKAQNERLRVAVGTPTTRVDQSVDHSHSSASNAGLPVCRNLAEALRQAEVESKNGDNTLG